MELITVHKRKGHYRLFENGEQFCYHFNGLPDGFINRRSFVFDDMYCFDLDVEIDESYTALDFAIDLRMISRKEYFFWSDEQYLQAIIEYLEQNADEQQKLLTQKLLRDSIEEKETLIKKIERLQAKIEKYEEMSK